MPFKAICDIDVVCVIFKSMSHLTIVNQIQKEHTAMVSLHTLNFLSIKLISILELTCVKNKHILSIFPNL